MPQPKDDTRLEVRSMPVHELRTDDGGTFSGYASVFNEETEIGGMFREVIMPGAFERAIKEGDDVRLLVNHDPSLLLGRTKSGTLRLQEDKHGLWMEGDPPNTQLAHDTMELVKRGDLDSMSFAFMVDEDGENWPKREEGKLPLREITSARLFDASIVTYPAYEGTSVGLRSAESVFNDHIQSLEGQESESDDNAERSEQELDRARAVVDVIKRK